MSDGNPLPPLPLLFPWSCLAGCHTSRQCQAAFWLLRLRSGPPAQPESGGGGATQPAHPGPLDHADQPPTRGCALLHAAWDLGCSMQHAATGRCLCAIQEVAACCMPQAVLHAACSNTPAALWVNPTERCMLHVIRAQACSRHAACVSFTPACAPSTAAVHVIYRSVLLTQGP